VSGRQVAGQRRPCWWRSHSLLGRSGSESISDTFDGPAFHLCSRSATLLLVSSPSIKNCTRINGLRFTLFCPLILALFWKLHSVLRSWRLVLGYFPSGRRNSHQWVVGFCLLPSGRRHLHQYVDGFFFLASGRRRHHQGVVCFRHSLRYARCVHRRNSYTPRMCLQLVLWCWSP